jgi:hypothetical protein
MIWQNLKRKQTKGKVTNFSWTLFFASESEELDCVIISVYNQSKDLTSQELLTPYLSLRQAFSLHYKKVTDQTGYIYGSRVSRRSHQ